MDARRALIAEDDAAIAQSLKALLEQQGLEVRVATSGAELAERLSTEGPFAVVVADIELPWMNGLQVMHRARWFGDHTPVIFISGLVEPELEEWVAELSGTAVLLRKPFDARSLLDVLARLVQR